MHYQLSILYNSAKAFALTYFSALKNSSSFVLVVDSSSALSPILLDSPTTSCSAVWEGLSSLDLVRGTTMDFSRKGTLLHNIEIYVEFN